MACTRDGLPTRTSIDIFDGNAMHAVELCAFCSIELQKFLTINRTPDVTIAAWNPNDVDEYVDNYYGPAVEEDFDSDYRKENIA